MKVFFFDVLCMAALTVQWLVFRINAKNAFFSANERSEGEGKGKEEEGKEECERRKGKGNWKWSFGRNGKNRKRPQPGIEPRTSVNAADALPLSLRDKLLWTGNRFKLHHLVAYGKLVGFNITVASGCLFAGSCVLWAGTIVCVCFFLGKAVQFFFLIFFTLFLTLYRPISQLLEDLKLAFALKEQYLNNYKRYHHNRHTVGKVFSLRIRWWKV